MVAARSEKGGKPAGAVVEGVDVSATVQVIDKEKRTLSLKRPDGKLVITGIDKYDLGTGSMAKVGAWMIPYQYLDKVFLFHLHTDHMGSINALWAGG